MATARHLNLHDNIMGGVETTQPAHLIGADKWRRQHNMRFTPMLEQVPRKVVHSTEGAEDVLWMGSLPANDGKGKVLLLTPTTLRHLNGAVVTSTLSTDSTYRRWSTCTYNSSLFYVNELNTIRSYNGSSDSEVCPFLKGRYLTTWYDHLVVGHPTYKGSSSPNRVMLSHLYNFADFEPTATNEADHYDFVEWQSTDYPYEGVTGLGKIRSALIVYTPTAIVPVRYVGIPKVIQVDEQSVLTRVGNTYPWTLVCLDNVHFFFDVVEQMFYAYDGQQLVPIGEPVRKHMEETLNPSYALASKTFGYVDIDNREIWWQFCSVDSTGDFDQAVVFNYRLKRWFTASCENVHAFCGGVSTRLSAGELLGTAGALTGTCGELGDENESFPRLYGTTAGNVLREETIADVDGVLLPADEPVLESGDFHYGDVFTTKENDKIAINATWDTSVTPAAKIEVKVDARDYLGDEPTWGDAVGEWRRDEIDKQLTFPVLSGRVFRYKFTGKNVRALKFAAFSEAVRVKQAEK